MASFKVQLPEKFSFKEQEWIKWIQRFEHFRLASGLSKEDEESQVNALIYSMGGEADNISQSFSLTEVNRKNQQLREYHRLL